jgi:putative nucleotidyltransferase with HDIG domain
LTPPEPAAGADAAPEPAPAADSTPDPAPGRRDPIPAAVRAIAGTLRAAGHEAHVVGGCVRDLLRGVEPADWDLTTNARPEQVVALFSGARYENRFGTVEVDEGGGTYEVTTYRHDGPYTDHRRPDAVMFGERLDDDLARRDFTVNAMAWGAEAPGPPGGVLPALADPFGGAADVRARVLRAVGDPDTRFHEDALRMLRAVRLAAGLEFTIEPRTLAAIARQAGLAAHLSGERVAAELERLLAAERPSVGLRLMAETGLLDVIAPEFAAQRGMAQNKIPGEDLWDHTLRAVDAPPPARPVVRLAALLHDVGKPATETPDGYPEHDKVGAEIAERILDRFHFPRATTARVVHLVRNHMFTYEAAWSDAAVRRFINRIGQHALEELFALREADNVGSGLPPDTGLVELRRRVSDQLEAHVALSLRDLAINGDDLVAEVGLAPGPQVGRILGSLLDQVIADSALNDRPTLLLLAQSMAGEDA